MQKVRVYIDGYNFYFGLKEMAEKDRSWKKFYWLDIVKFYENMLTKNQQLDKVIYFSSRPHDIQASKRQDLLFSANKLNNKFQLVLGKYIKKKIRCKHCHNFFDTYEEKETDVRLATQIINDVYNETCDISIIVSADSDIIPAVELVKEINPNHKVFVNFPPLRFSVNLSNFCDGMRKLSNYESKFNKSMLPDEVILPNGVNLCRPQSWR